MKRAKISSLPKLNDGRLVLGFSGWLDGGDVSTGTVDLFTQTLGATEVGRIDPEDYYLLSMPGDMELASVFRPQVSIEDGLVIDMDMPQCVFHCDKANDLLLFTGDEPHMRWAGFSEALLEVAASAGVTSIYFVGSVAGAVPHTRAPRLFTVCTDEEMKQTMVKHRLMPSNYEGPGSFVTYLMTRAPAHHIRMATIVAEVPAYVQGTMPRCIEAVSRVLAAVLGLSIDFEELRQAGDEWEKRVDEALVKEEELAEHVRRLEADYDNEVFDTQMSDLKDFLQRRGIRLD